jgi:hypothetical protein
MLLSCERFSASSSSRINVLWSECSLFARYTLLGSYIKFVPTTMRNIYQTRLHAVPLTNPMDPKIIPLKTMRPHYIYTRSVCTSKTTQFSWKPFKSKYSLLPTGASLRWQIPQDLVLLQNGQQGAQKKVRMQQSPALIRQLEVYYAAREACTITLSPCSIASSFLHSDHVWSRIPKLERDQQTYHTRRTQREW